MTIPFLRLSCRLSFLRPSGLTRAVAALAALCGLTAFPADTQAAPPQYTVTDLGALEPDVSASFGINATGQVTGFAHRTGVAADRAVRWTGTTGTELGNLGGLNEAGFGINDSGQVAGQASVDDGTAAHTFRLRAVRWTGTTPMNLGTLPGELASVAFGINTSGQVSGTSLQPDGVDHAVRWTGNTPIDLGALTGDGSSHGFGINDSGEIAGTYRLADGAVDYAVRWTDTTPTFLETLAGDESSYALSINASGQIAGYSTTAAADGAVSHAVKWKGTKPIPLGTLGGSNSFAYSINRVGDVTGVSDKTGDTGKVPFLYTRGVMYNLNDLLVSGSNATDLTFTRPRGEGAGGGINDFGQIAATATIGGKLHAIRLDPVRPAPPHYTVVELGGAVTGGYSNAVAINASGQVTGFGGDQFLRAFRWTGTTGVTLDTLGGNSSLSYGINASGQISGYSYALGDGPTRAVRWTGTTAVELTSLGGYEAEGYGINDSGQVAGWSHLPDNNEAHAVRWTGTSPTDLGTIGGLHSEGKGINASGQVVGFSTDASGVTHAVRWTGTTPETLESLTGAIYASAYGINASGQAVGVLSESDGTTHAVRWIGTTIEDLGDLGSADSLCAAINTAGDIVGMSGNHPFLYTGGAMYDLENLLVANPGISSLAIENGNSINDRGQIAAWAYFIADGERHAIRLDPSTGGGGPNGPLTPPTDLTVETAAPPTSGNDFHFQARQDTTAPGATKAVG